MPSWKVHLVFNSLLLFVWIKFLLNYSFVNDYILLIFLIFFNSFLSIFPDVDYPKSRIRDVLAVMLASIATIYFFLNLTFNSILSLLVSFVFLYILFKFFPTKHRGITHNFWFSALFSFVLTGILRMMFDFSLINFVIYFIFILSGYVSHLFLDMMRIQ